MEIARGTGGSFSVVVQVNGARIRMVLDTGASSVVLTQEAARAAGLPLEVLEYSVNVDTANGRARAAPLTLDRVSIGGIAERSVPALVAQPGAAHQPARDELPQPPGELGGARRPAAAARLSVIEYPTGSSEKPTKAQRARKGCRNRSRGRGLKAHGQAAPQRAR